jgi:hypothetical protein
MSDSQQQPQEEQPLFSFGVIADAQYADLPDGDTEGRCQRFREVPAKLAAALAALASHRPPLALVLHMGDIVNGNPAGQAQCDAEFDLVASIFDQELVSVTGHTCCGFRGHQSLPVCLVLAHPPALAHPSAC